MTAHGVWTQRPDWGDAKIVTSSESGDVSLEYFVLPGTDARRIEVSPGDVLPPLYERGRRVFFADDSGTLRSGRLADKGLHDARHVALEYPGPVSSGPVLLVHVTGGGKRSSPPELLEICSDVEVDDPTPVLAATANEGWWWFNTRTQLARALAKERSVFRGLSGLASASIDLHPHQIQVARQVLGDPVCRYILADEVGLGKTIEAGIVIRQHVLESSGDFRVLVVGPEHLTRQWESELEQKFGLREEISLGSVNVSSFAGVQGLIEDMWEGSGPEMLVIDEAHHLATLAFSGDSQERALYELLTEISDQASRVLLLSATPVLRDTSGFLAMLHLLDRGGYDIDDLAGFDVKVQAREAVSSIAYLLSRPVRPMFRSGVLQQLEEAAGGDETVVRLTADLEEAWEAADDAAAKNSRLELHGYICSAHQVYRRLIRTRRDAKSVEEDMPSREFRVLEVEAPFQEKVTVFLDDWRLARLDAREGDTPFQEDANLFANWVRLALDTPKSLLTSLRDRYVDLDQGGTEAFFDEVGFLEAHIPGLEEAVAATARPVFDFLERQPPDNNWVVFLSDEDLCTQVSVALGPRAGVVGEQQDHAGILLVPQASEEGTNLQRRQAFLLHADVPMSTVRIEQRIGRMDRLNSANVVVHSVVLSTPGSYQGAWVEATTTAARVFEESVSSLQYLMADAEDRLRADLLEHGREAFQRYANMLSAADGEFSLEQEAYRLKRQDVLDAAQMLTDESWFNKIEDYEFDEFEETVLALNRWLVEGLRFRPIDPQGQPFALRFDPRRPYRLRLSDRHLTMAQTRRWFGKAIDQGANGLPNNLRGRVTGICAGERSRAGSGTAALTRVGHPLVSGVQQMLKADDRGRAFAIRLAPTGGNLAPCFRFDIRLEGTPPASDPTLVRRTEEVLPPLYKTIWLDSEGQPVLPDLVEALERGLRSNTAKSIVGREAWDAVLTDLDADWPTLVVGLRDVALGMAATTEEWVRRCSKAGEQIEAAKSELASALRARESFGQSDAKSEMWGRELFFLDQLEETVRSAGPEIEAVGAVFHDAHILGTG